MTIKELMIQSAKAPYVSVKSDDISTTLILEHQHDHGRMTFFQIFSGITLAYIDIDADLWPAPVFDENVSDSQILENAKGLLIINYCVKGRCELVLNSHDYVYVNDHHLSLTERYAQDSYRYPGHCYQGLELFIDLDETIRCCPWIFDQFELDLNKLITQYCPDGKTYISPANERISKAFIDLWNLLKEKTASDKDTVLFPIKMMLLELFQKLLSDSNTVISKPCTFYTESQVNIAKTVEGIITSELAQNHPVRELAQRFGVSESSLKNYFRGVYGQNISTYLRKIRMQKASDLLVNTRTSVAEIAGAVGYSNQSKFAAVFKKEYRMSPLEYRRTYCLKQQ